MLKSFRAIAILEGISYLMLFGISMPLKYWAEIREPNIYIGNVHGILFILYAILAVMVNRKMGWSLKRLAILLVASLLPFGTFYIDEKYIEPELGATS